MKFKASMEEEGIEKAIYLLEEEQRKAIFPIQPILQSILADFYDSYLNNQLWKLRNRSTTDERTEDIRTWSVEDFINRTNELYAASLNDKLKLFDTPITQFPAIIQTNDDNALLRPTLYDFLAHRAIDYYRMDRNYLSQSAYRFTLDEEKVFEPAVYFVQIRFDTKDTASQKLKAILLIQDLLAFRINDKDNLPALVDLDLKRLKMMKEFSVQKEVDKSYEAALLELIEQYENA